MLKLKWPIIILSLVFSFFLLQIVFLSIGTRCVETQEKVVALTFDDGPQPPYTEELLQALEDKGVKATFFLIGRQIEDHPEVARMILEARHEVGSHSYDWELLAFKRVKTIESELNKMDEVFEDAGISNVVFFRPSYGVITPDLKKILNKRGLIHISANVVVGDWKNIEAEELCSRVLKKVRPGSIIVLHDGGGDRSNTIAAVPMIITQLEKKGYVFLTVGELLGSK